MSQTRFLSEYRPWPFRLHETRLDVTLAPRGTRVQSELRLERVSAGDLTLDGGAGLRTFSVAIDGTPVPETALTLAAETYKELRTNVINTVLNAYQETGYSWEQYDPEDGHGRRGHPFTGWTSTVVLMMAEEY